jgi:NitT/TauT family transport system substrate-binding protein
VLITTREYAAKNPQKVRAFIEGRRRGVDFIYQNPTEAGRIVAKAYDMPEKVGIEAVQLMAKAKQWSHGDIDLKEYKTLAEGLKLTGELTSDVEWDKLIDASYLPDDLRKKSVLK